MVVDVVFNLFIDNVELVDKLFKLLLIVVVVVVKLLIDIVELVDKLFKLLKMVVDVVFNLFIDNVELVDKLFKLLKMVVDVAFKLLIDDIVFGPMTDPAIFNDDNIVALFDVKLYEVISYIPELFIILFIIY
jgi:hypothetical protein